MESKVAIVTGGSRGIGAETVRFLANEGYAVCINYVSNDETARALEAEVKELGARCISVKADVSVENDVERLFNTVDSELGTVTVLVNNAGILMEQSRLEDLSIERFTKVLNTNVLSCFLCSKQAVKRMSTKHGGIGGTIVNVSSGAAKSGSPNEYVDYASSKGAMDTLTRGLAMEVAGEGIRVNGVRPALIYTDMHASGGEANRVERLSSIVPLKRGGQAQEVAEAILWLASDKSSFVTGSFIDTTGGL